MLVCRKFTKRQHLELQKKRRRLIVRCIKDVFEKGLNIFENFYRRRNNCECSKSQHLIKYCRMFKYWRYINKDMFEIRDTETDTVNLKDCISGLVFNNSIPRRKLLRNMSWFKSSRKCIFVYLYNGYNSPQYNLCSLHSSIAGRKSI